MNANEKDFARKLEILDALYEEGKDCLSRIPVPLGCPQDQDYIRLYEILREMRDIAATQMRAIHDVPQN